MLEQALRQCLLAVAAIANIVGTRIHVGETDFPDPDTQLPAITLERRRTKRAMELDGTACDLQFPIFDVVAHGLLWETTLDLIDKCRAALETLSLGASVTISVNGGPVTIPIEQVDLIEDDADAAEHIGHGNTDKPSVLTIRVGWREP